MRVGAVPAWMPMVYVVVTLTRLSYGFACGPVYSRLSLTEVTSWIISPSVTSNDKYRAMEHIL
jgi:hypothetical protein